MYRRVLIAAFLTASAFFTAHSINLTVAHVLTRSVAFRQVPAKTENRQAPQVNRLQLTEEILTSGVFGGPDIAVEKVSVQTPGQDVPSEIDTVSSMGPPIDAARRIRLIGTVTGEDHISMAIVEETSTKKQTLYRLHDVIVNVGQIAQIRKDAILIRQGAQQELLKLEYAVIVPFNSPIVIPPPPAAIGPP